MKTHFGYTPLLWDGKYWCEAYGYLGSWYKTYQAAMREIKFLLRNYPEKYSEWRIERIVLDEDLFRVSDNRECLIAQSKNAPE